MVAMVMTLWIPRMPPVHRKLSIFNLSCSVLYIIAVFQIRGVCTKNKSRFYGINCMFSNFRWGVRRVRPHRWIHPCIVLLSIVLYVHFRFPITPFSNSTLSNETKHKLLLNPTLAQVFLMI